MFELLLILAIVIGVYGLLRPPKCPCKDCDIQCFMKLDKIKEKAE